MNDGQTLDLFASPGSKRCSRCRAVKPRDAFWKDRSRKDGMTSGCKECIAARHSLAYAAKRGTLLAKIRAYRVLHRKEEIERARLFALANPEKVRAYKKKSKAAHREQNLAYARARRAANGEKERDRCRRWHAANVDRVLAKNAARLAQKLRALPKWADRQAIALLYREAKRKSIETGVAHVVDHVYPLRGRTVSGLHVPDNLRVITSLENARKGNRHPEDLRR